jgi:hypothetical protein
MATYTNSISESFSNLEILLHKQITLNTIPDIIESLDSILINHSLIHLVEENVNLSVIVSSEAIANNTLSDILSLLDNTNISFNDIVPENLAFTDSSYFTLKVLLELLEYLKINDILIDSVIYKNTLSDLLTLASPSYLALVESVVEPLALQATLDTLYKAIVSIVETLGILEASSSFISLFIETADEVLIEDNESNRAILRSLVDSRIIFKNPTEPSSTYLAYLLSPETSSVSNYSNYNFNGCTKFGYKYLFYNRTGLYEYGGYLDDGDKVRSEIETIAFNFQTSNLKQVPAVYLGVDSTDSVILKVRVDGKAEVHYKLNKFTNNLMTQKIDIGKGLIGRYFQFEIITEASEFNMESIEFYPLEIRRKL